MNSTNCSSLKSRLAHDQAAGVFGELRVESWLKIRVASVAQPPAVAQPSAAAGSGTVPVRVSATGGETPPQPAGGDACATTRLK